MLLSSAELAIEKMFMTKTAERTVVRSIHQKREQIATLREELEDLNDYLDLTEARVRDAGEPRQTHKFIHHKERRDRKAGSISTEGNEGEQRTLSADFADFRRFGFICGHLRHLRKDSLGLYQPPSNPPHEPRFVLLCKLMLPNAEHTPARSPQRPRHQRIPFFVSRQFAPPECAIVGRLGRVPGTAMPETAVH